MSLQKCTVHRSSEEPHRGSLFADSATVGEKAMPLLQHTWIPTVLCSIEVCRQFPQTMTSQLWQVCPEPASPLLHHLSPSKPMERSFAQVEGCLFVSLAGSTDLDLIAGLWSLSIFYEKRYHDPRKALCGQALPGNRLASQQACEVCRTVFIYR